MTIDEGTKATANPTKEFFVKMITRDITLEDCILDLIDNSVDGAWRSEGSRPMGLAEDADLSKYSIAIFLDLGFRAVQRLLYDKGEKLLLQLR